jgi:ABC-type transport system involved in multi-copper enzyme maturation permease subunit
VFDGLVGATFVLCCAACLLTADTISAERREGTLGLLLLTAVKPLDLLLGKFASSGLACLLGLVALLPVLALPLLSGGVSGGEAARTAAVLLNTLFLALSVGLWASARGVDRFRTARNALLVLAGLVLGPGLLGLLLPGTHAGMASPLGTIVQAADLAYRKSAGRYWLSLGLVQVFSWALLLDALARLRGQASGSEDGVSERAATAGPPGGWVEAASPSLASALPAPVSSSRSPTKCRYCGHENPAETVHCPGCGTGLSPKDRPREHACSLSSAPTPLHWLLQRQRGLRSLLWVAGAIGFGGFALLGMGTRFFGWGLGPMFVGFSWALSLVTKAIMGSLVAWVASRFFVEARRSGELELLLTTPVGAAQIVSTQWDVLKRLARWPVLLMLAPIVFRGLMLPTMGPGQSGLWRLYYALSLVLSAANMVLSVGALCWLGMWFGWRVTGQGRAILWTVLIADGLPWVLGLAWSLLCPALIALAKGPSNPWSNSPWLLAWLTSQLAALLFYDWLIRLARRQLLEELGGAEPLAPRHVLSRALPRIATAVRRAREWPAVERRDHTAGLDQT